MHCRPFTAEQTSYKRQLVIIGLFLKGGPNYAPTQQAPVYCGIGGLNGQHNGAANQAYTHGAH